MARFLGKRRDDDEPPEQRRDARPGDGRPRPLDRPAERDAARGGYDRDRFGAYNARPDDDADEKKGGLRRFMPGGKRDNAQDDRRPSNREAPRLPTSRGAPNSPARATQDDEKKGGLRRFLPGGKEDDKKGGAGQGSGRGPFVGSSGDSGPLRLGSGSPREVPARPGEMRPGDRPRGYGAPASNTGPTRDQPSSFRDRGDPSRAPGPARSAPLGDRPGSLSGSSRDRMAPGGGVPRRDFDDDDEDDDAPRGYGPQRASPFGAARSSALGARPGAPDTFGRRSADDESDRGYGGPPRSSQRDRPATPAGSPFRSDPGRGAPDSRSDRFDSAARPGAGGDRPGYGAPGSRNAPPADRSRGLQLGTPAVEPKVDRTSKKDAKPDKKKSGRGPFGLGKKDDKKGAGDKPARPTGAVSPPPSRGGLGALAGAAERAGATGRGQPRSEASAPSGRPSQRAPSSASRSAPSRRAAPLPDSRTKGAFTLHQGLDRDRKIDLIGIALVAFGLVAFFAVIPSITLGVLPQPEAGLTGMLDQLLSQVFGWGKVVWPVVALVLGIWLMKERFEERDVDIDYFRIVGAISLYACLLATLHMVELINDPAPTVDAFRPVSYDLAIEQGRGGGWLGHQMYVFLLSQLLDFGTVSVLLAWLVMSLMLTFDLSVVELWGYALAGLALFRITSPEERARKRVAREALTAEVVEAMRPGDSGPRQMALDQAAAGMPAASAAPRGAPIINRRAGAATQETATAGTALTATTAPGPGLEAERETTELMPSRRRLPHLRRADSAETAPASQAAAPDPAVEAAVSDVNAGGRFPFLKRRKAEQADPSVEISLPGAAAELEGADARPDIPVAPLQAADAPVSSPEEATGSRWLGRLGRSGDTRAGDSEAGAKTGEGEASGLRGRLGRFGRGSDAAAAPEDSQALEADATPGGVRGRLGRLGRGTPVGHEPADTSVDEMTLGPTTGEGIEPAQAPPREGSSTPPATRAASEPTPERIELAAGARRPFAAREEPPVSIDLHADRASGPADPPSPAAAPDDTPASQPAAVEDAPDHPSTTAPSGHSSEDEIARAARTPGPVAEERHERHKMPPGIEAPGDPAPHAEPAEEVAASAFGAAALLGLSRRIEDHPERDRATEPPARDPLRSEPAPPASRGRSPLFLAAERRAAEERASALDDSDADGDAGDRQPAAKPEDSADTDGVLHERPAQPAHPELAQRRFLPGTGRGPDTPPRPQSPVQRGETAPAEGGAAPDAGIPARPGSQPARYARASTTRTLGPVEVDGDEATAAAPVTQPDSPAAPADTARATVETARVVLEDTPESPAQAPRPAREPNTAAPTADPAATPSRSGNSARQPSEPAAGAELPRLPTRRENRSSAPPQRDQQPAAGSGQRPAPERRASQPTPVRGPHKSRWELPDYRKLLRKGEEQRIRDEVLLEKARVIEDTLASFGAPGKVVEVNPGPVITQFGVEPDYLLGRGGRRTRVKVGAIARLDADISLALAAKTIRIEAPVPGRGFVGIEVPNDEVANVNLHDIMGAPEFRNIDSKLRVALGLSVDGTPVAADLTMMPHLLIAGTTGSGKSVCVNSIISTLLLENTPDDVQLIMVDPKRVELTGYNGIPHLVAPVVVELERIVGVLQWVQREMEERYRKFAAAGARNIVDYNKRLKPDDKRMPYYVVIVDELADLMMLAPDETERLLARLAQMARATGIHLIISTQRPSVDIITGLIKANFPARIAFAVASGVDSRVILDQPGADKLLGRGDMLFQSPDAAAPVRMQGVFVSDEEINAITAYWKGQVLRKAEASGTPEVLASPNRETRLGGRAMADAGTGPTQAAQSPLWDEDDDETPDGEDELYGEAVALVQRLKKASISLLQRRLRIGYTRAARLIDKMEADGIVGPAQEGSKPREVIKFTSETGDD